VPVDSELLFLWDLCALWGSRKILPENLHSRFSFVKYVSFVNQLSTFCASNSIYYGSVLTHPLTVQSMNSILPSVSNKDRSQQGMFIFFVFISDTYFLFVCSFTVVWYQGGYIGGSLNPGNQGKQYFSSRLFRYLYSVVSKKFRRLLYKSSQFL